MLVRRWQFDAETASFIRFDGELWLREPEPAEEYNLLIEGRADQWIAMFRAAGNAREELLDSLHVSGDPADVLEFEQLFSSEASLITG